MKKVSMAEVDVKNIIPHREPMLLVDDVILIEPEHSVTTRWYIKPNLDIFKGHFPSEPLLPGVYTVENMAQTADILVLSTERYAGKTPLFLGIDKVKFFSKIKPGDTVETRAVLLKDIAEKAIVTCCCEVHNGGVLACVGEITLAMR